MVIIRQWLLFAIVNAYEAYSSTLDNPTLAIQPTKASKATNLLSDLPLKSSLPYARRAADAPAPTSADCQYNQHPDDGGRGYCTCSYGDEKWASFDTAHSSDPDYVPCPWTTLPSASEVGKPVTASPTFISGANFLRDNAYVACPSAQVFMTQNDRSTSCIGPETTVSWKPTSSVMLGNSSVRVGELTGTAMHSSMSSVLNTACPTTTSACTEPTATITNVIYYNDWDRKDIGKDHGTIEANILYSNYNESLTQQKLINAVATAVNATTQGDVCTPEYFYKNSYTMTDCYGVNFVSIILQDEHRNLYGEIDVELKFHPYPGEEHELPPNVKAVVTCEKIMEVVADAFMVFGRFVGFGEEAGQDWEVGCQLIGRAAGAAAHWSTMVARDASPMTLTPSLIG